MNQFVAKPISTRVTIRFDLFEIHVHRRSFRETRRAGCEAHHFSLARALGRGHRKSDPF